MPSDQLHGYFFLDSILLEAAHTCSYIVRVARVQRAQKNRKRPRDGTTTDSIVEQHILNETRPTEASLLVNTKYGCDEDSDQKLDSL